MAEPDVGLQSRLDAVFGGLGAPQRDPSQPAPWRPRAETLFRRGVRTDESDEEADARELQRRQGLEGGGGGTEAQGPAMQV